MMRPEGVAVGTGGDGQPGEPGHSGSLASVLAASGTLGQDLLAVDWSSTPLGPMDTWPHSLQAAVRIVVSSRFSMWMAWGPDLTFFCNEAYRRDTLGVKYPWALGRSAREVWAEIWPDIGPRIDTVLRTGQATWDESLLLFLERSGYREETYHTFSYSPLPDDDGRIAGMLCVVSEDTERVIALRRMATLRDLSAEQTAVDREAQVWAAAARQLSADQRSLPFTLTYLFTDDQRNRARLACSTGWPPHHPAAPETLTDDAIWPMSAAADESEWLVDVADLENLPTGAWDEPPLQAFAVPLEAPGQQGPYGLLIAGLNRYRIFDDGYRTFIRLIAGQLATRLAAVRAYETERSRAEALAELDRAKTAFFTNVSHEFRTPLTLLLGPAEDALSDQTAPLPAVQRRRLEVISRNAQRLLRLVNTLLDFSRLQSGRVTARFEPTDLARMTAELAAMFESAVERAGLTLTVQCEPLPEPVFVDREMWSKIVLNLISNALKFTFDGGIEVRVAAADGGARLTVSDTGIGIAAEDQPRLFERFHRVLGARSRSHEGSGIGLALVAELTELHGGSVAVDSTPGRGTTFTVTVPFGEGHLPKDQLAAGTDDGADSEAAQRRAADVVAEAMRWLSQDDDGYDGDREPATRSRILVADDNADMRSYLAGLLSSDYRVDAVADGEAALELARRDPPDLVLTDVMMPRLDGFGLLRALREGPTTAHVPVVMISARAGEEGMIEGLDAGADDYLIKPFSARELLARVRTNLELDRSRRTQETLQESRRLLDQAQRLAKVGSWELNLTNNTFVTSDELLRIIDKSADELRELGLAGAVEALVHPDDRDGVIESVRRAARERSTFSYDTKIRVNGRPGTVRVVGEPVIDDAGELVGLRGSLQDITEQQLAEQALTVAAAEREAAVREHSIADQLQTSLLPEREFDPELLRVATFYRAGVAGTQVGGDWYDVIELGAGRTALVIGDVMGRGVAAAAVMGQIRSAIRAYARLDLLPVDVLEHLDGVVRGLGTDQIVTCIYAVYDPHDRSVRLANAGHLPPLLAVDGHCEPVGQAGPPLGAGPLLLDETEIRELTPGSMLAFYTDGLVEHRERDIQAGIDVLAEALRDADLEQDLPTLPDRLVARLLPEGPDDDVAMLLATLPIEHRLLPAVSLHVDPASPGIAHARQLVATTLTDWGVRPERVDDIVLCADELVTNAVLHSKPPITLRIRRNVSGVSLQIDDGLSGLPRRTRAGADDEHGRGVQIVAMLSDEWGSRPTRFGKSVWCNFRL
ncbi:MAG TPA: SpoIIE family protein phosphatase [Mycobacteriales bacterium]|nr:SpoIIE family protein phosphatase [Mycobacteriales bacterium]